NQNVKLDEVREEVLNLLGHGMDAEENEEPSDTSALDAFGRDLTRLARENALDPVIGHESEIARVTQILMRRSGNCPLLVGEPGVGKTAIVEGVAQVIAGLGTPPALRAHRIIAIDARAVLAGSGPDRDAAARLRGLLDEARGAKNVILFLESLHYL